MKSRAPLVLAFVLGLAAISEVGAAPGLAFTVVGGQGQGGGADQLDTPYAITLGPDGDLYVSDGLNGRVQRAVLNADGEAVSVTTVLGGGTVSPLLATPYGMAFASDGTMYLAEAGAARIVSVTFDANGSPTVQTIAGQSTLAGDDTLSAPRGLALAPDGALFVADSFGGRVRRIVFDNAGAAQSITTVILPIDLDVQTLWFPQGLAFDDAGVLYISDAFGDIVHRVVLDGAGLPQSSLEVVGGATGNPVVDPNGLAIGPDGDLFIAEITSHRVLRVGFDVLGAPISLETVAGTGVAGSGDDEFDSANGVAVTASGVLLVNDVENHRVQRVVFDETEPTIAVPSVTATRVGQVVVLPFSCEDTGGAGIQSCTTTRNGLPFVAGQPFVANARGQQNFVVTGVDRAGNSTVHSWSLTVFGKRELTGPYANTLGTDGRVARLYMAAFNREPDAVGFDYWTERVRAGTTMQEVADYFVLSPEMLATNGTAGNDDLVELLYRNVMGRAADSAGRTYWTAELEGGMSQARMLLLFSDASEFRTLSNTN